VITPPAPLSNSGFLSVKLIKNCLASIAKVRHVFGDSLELWQITEGMQAALPRLMLCMFKSHYYCFSERTVSLCHFLRVEISIAGSSFLLKPGGRSHGSGGAINPGQMKLNIPIYPGHGVFTQTSRKY